MTGDSPVCNAIMATDHTNLRATSPHANSSHTSKLNSPVCGGLIQWVEISTTDKLGCPPDRALRPPEQVTTPTYEAKKSMMNINKRSAMNTHERNTHEPIVATSGLTLATTKHRSKPMTRRHLRHLRHLLAPLALAAMLLGLASNAAAQAPTVSTSPGITAPCRRLRRDHHAPCTRPSPA